MPCRQAAEQAAAMPGPSSCPLMPISPASGSPVDPTFGSLRELARNFRTVKVMSLLLPSWVNRSADSASRGFKHRGRYRADREWGGARPVGPPPSHRQDCRAQARMIGRTAGGAGGIVQLERTTRFT